MRTAPICSLVMLWAAALCSHANAAACPAHITETLEIRGSTLCLLIDDPTPSRRQLLRTWVARSANVVADYYGRFPAPLVALSLQSMEGGGIGGGRTTNDSGLMIHVRVGHEATSDALSDDWVLVHEMVHLALP